MSAQDLRIPLDSERLTIAAKEWPNTSASLPTLALHGWLDNAGSFEPLAPYLGSRHLLALDWIGHGQSDHLPPGQSYQPFPYVAHAFAVADALAWSKFHLLGHSLGACIATLMAGIFPERVASLVLLEGLGPLSCPAADTPAQYRKYLQAAKSSSKKSLPTYPSREAAALVRSQNSNVDLASARILAERGTKQLQDGRFTWTTDRRLRLPTPQPLTEEQVLAFIRRISCPSLLILAKDGWPYEKAEFARRQTELGGLKTLTLEGSHHLHMEHPEAVAAAINHHLG